MNYVGDPENIQITGLSAGVFNLSTKNHSAFSCAMEKQVPILSTSFFTMPHNFQMEQWRLFTLL